MDTSSILTALLSSSNIKNIGKAADASTADVKNVLTSAIPSLLTGVSSQATSASTAAGLLQALTSHASDSSGKIDLADGAKILSHLLGSSEQKTTNAVAKESGVDKAKVTSILSAAAPLLLSALGKETSSSGLNAKTIGSVLGGLSSNNVGSLLTGLLGGSSSSSGSDKKDGLSQAASLLGSLLK